MENQLKVQQVPNGYVVPEKVYIDICNELSDTSAKLKFIKSSLLLIEEKYYKETYNSGIYGLDAIINDIITTCDKTYEKLAD